MKMIIVALLVVWHNGQVHGVTLADNGWTQEECDAAVQLVEDEYKTQNPHDEIAGGCYLVVSDGI